MARLRPLVPFLALFSLLVLQALSADPAQAGWGDALKQKASKALKTEKPKSEGETGPVKSRMSPEVTAEALARFQRGLEVESAEREKAKKFLATLPKPEARKKCTEQVATSGDAQKILQDYTDAASAGKAEDIPKHMERMSHRMDSLVTAKCGPDPGKYNASQMERDALAKGSDTAALGDDDAYYRWKEWVVEFCRYLEKLQKQPDAPQQLAKMKDEGLRIPGSGTGVYFVYSASEVALLLDLCPKLKPLIEATL